MANSSSLTLGHLLGWQEITGSIPFDCIRNNLKDWLSNSLHGPNGTLFCRLSYTVCVSHLFKKSYLVICYAFKLSNNVCIYRFGKTSRFLWAGQAFWLILYYLSLVNPKSWTAKYRFKELRSTNPPRGTCLRTQFRVIKKKRKGKNNSWQDLNPRHLDRKICAVPLSCNCWLGRHFRFLTMATFFK